MKTIRRSGLTKWIAQTVRAEKAVKVEAYESLIIVPERKPTVKESFFQRKGVAL